MSIKGNNENEIYFMFFGGWWLEQEVVYLKEFWERISAALSLIVAGSFFLLRILQWQIMVVLPCVVKAMSV